MNFNTTKFSLGSTVAAFGVEGEVIEVNLGGFATDGSAKATGVVLTGYILVKFDDKRETFNLDGKLESWHAEPSLKLVRRAEEFEEVVGYQTVSMAYNSIHFPEYINLGGIFRSKEDALNRTDAIGYREVKYMRRKT